MKVPCQRDDRLYHEKGETIIAIFQLINLFLCQ